MPESALTPLTDDEVVALAGFGQLASTGVLASVADPASADQAESMAAVVRGVRSLVLRGLASFDDPELTPSSVLAEELDLLNRPVGVGYAIEAGSGWLPGLVNVGLRPVGPGQVVVETTDGMGVHHFGLTTTDAACRTLGSLVAAVFENGVGEDPDYRLRVYVIDDSGRSTGTFTLTRGSVSADGAGGGTPDVALVMRLVSSRLAA